MKSKAVLFFLILIIFSTLACQTPDLFNQIQSSLAKETETLAATSTKKPSSTPRPSATATPIPTATPTIAPSPTVIMPDILGSVTNAQGSIANRSFVLCKVEGTNCVMTGLTTTSDENGYFEFFDVPVGDYYLFYDSGYEDFNAGVKKWEGKTIFIGDVQWLSDNFITKNDDGGISFTIVSGMSFDDNIAYMAVYRFFATSPFFWAHTCGTQNCAVPEDVIPVVANVNGNEMSEVAFEIYGPFSNSEETGEATPTTIAGSSDVEVISQDDFSDPASGWDVSEDKISERLYQNGEYILRVGPGVSTSGESDYSDMYEDWAYLSWSPAGLSDLMNVAIDFDVRSLGETIDGGYGIAFYYQDSGQFYFYEIYPGGQWALVKRGPQGSSDIVGWTESGAIYTDMESNHIRLELREDGVSLYINGQLLSNESISYKSGDIAFYAETWNENNLIFEAGFDNFIVSKLP